MALRALIFFCLFGFVVVVFVSFFLIYRSTLSVMLINCIGAGPEARPARLHGWESNLGPTNDWSDLTRPLVEILTLLLWILRHRL